MKLSTALVLLFALAPAVLGGTFYPPNQEDFAFAGHWQFEGKVAMADWPCSGLQFSITTEVEGPSSIALRMNLRRARVSVVVTNSDSGLVESETVLEGSSVFNFEKDYHIVLPNDKGTYTVSLRKLTQAAPYGNGLGGFMKSVVQFHGVEVNLSHTLGSSPFPTRRVTMIGASDTAGYCADGTPETTVPTLNSWKYDNCDMTSHGVLGRRLNAVTSVQAIAGIGLTQNAFADKPFMLGKDTMSEYYNRALQTKKAPLWDFQDAARPDLVMISLGGNDFNHQKNVPSNATFEAAYEDFILKIAEPYMEDGRTPPTIVSVCGQGDPTEHARDPNNDRCRPCPHVKDATEAFQAKHGDIIRAEFVFVPCDGSVITGADDIGCDGHKNRLGHEKVADFLEPRLRDIMGWSDEESAPIKPAGRSRPKPMAEKDASSEDCDGCETNTEKSSYLRKRQGGKRRQ